MDVIANGIWAERFAEHRFMGLALGTRTTIVRLDDGGLLVHSPIPLRERLKKEVDSFGEVRVIVCPNVYHHLFAGDWVKAYPEARLHGPANLAAKRRDLAFHGTLEDGFPGLVPVPIEGCSLEETVFVHPKTRTLVTSDLTENFREMDHFVTRQYLKMNGTFGKIGWPWLLRILYRDKKKTRASLDRLLEHDFDRLVIAHGDIIEKDAKDAIAETFGFLD